MSASSMKTIKNRIRSIKSTMQITKAMQLVASSKMRKATERAARTKPYFDLLSETLSQIAADNNDFSSVFTREREGRACRIVIAGDRGLAGGYNQNLFRSLEIGEDDLILPIGKKAVEYFAGRQIYTDKYAKAENVGFEDCREIAALTAKAFEKGEFTRLTLTYTEYINAITQEPRTVELLPLRAENTEKRMSLTLYEPSAEGVFARIVPYYIAGMLLGAVSDAFAAEQSARRSAMESATDNAEQMINDLSLEYNRARQASITQELTEIIAGAENL